MDWSQNMNNLKIKFLSPLTFSAIVACAATAEAVNVNPGDTVSISGTTVAARPELAGPILADIFIPYSFTDTATGGLVSGMLQDRVVKEASGTLDFYYRVIQDANSGGPVGAVRTSGFGTGSTDSDYRLDGTGTVAPVDVTRFTGSLAGDLNFSFSDGGGSPVEAGQSSYFMFIKTTATGYDQNGLTDISADYGAGDQGFSSELATFEPVAVPEPACMALLGGIGVLVGSFVTRRKHSPE